MLSSAIRSLEVAYAGLEWKDSVSGGVRETLGQSRVRANPGGVEGSFDSVFGFHKWKREPFSRSGAVEVGNAVHYIAG